MVGFGAGRASLLYTARYVGEGGEVLAQIDGQQRHTGQEIIGGETIVLTTTHDRRGRGVSRAGASPIDYDGRLFVAANRWPRAWYHRALENPDVSVTRNGETTDYRAVPVSEEERERLLDESGFPLVAYFFTGFAPRQFLRLDPR